MKDVVYQIGDWACACEDWPGHLLKGKGAFRVSGFRDAETEHYDDVMLDHATQDSSFKHWAGRALRRATQDEIDLVEFKNGDWVHYISKDEDAQFQQLTPNAPWSGLLYQNQTPATNKAFTHVSPEKYRELIGMETKFDVGDWCHYSGDYPTDRVTQAYEWKIAGRRLATQDEIDAVPIEKGMWIVLKRDFSCSFPSRSVCACGSCQKEYRHLTPEEYREAIKEEIEKEADTVDVIKNLRLDIPEDDIPLEDSRDEMLSVADQAEEMLIEHAAWIQEIQDNNVKINEQFGEMLELIKAIPDEPPTPVTSPLPPLLRDRISKDGPYVRVGDSHRDRMGDYYRGTGITDGTFRGHGYVTLYDAALEPWIEPVAVVDEPTVVVEPTIAHPVLFGVACCVLTSIITWGSTLLAMMPWE